MRASRARRAESEIGNAVEVDDSAGLAAAVDRFLAASEPNPTSL